MGLALKKHLIKMELTPGALILLHVPANAPDERWRSFAEEVARQVKAAGAGPLLVVRPGFSFHQMTDEDLAKQGLQRIEATENV